MANVFDVAKYILQKEGSLTAMKLEKLCYYAQAWQLVWSEKRLFKNQIQAWENGPVTPDLYNWHRRQFIVDINSDLEARCENNLNADEIDTINCVLRDYDKYTAQQLSDLTHQERPWDEIYKENKEPDGRCSAEIPVALIHEYYSGLQNVQ